MAAYDRKDWRSCGQMLALAGDAYNAACCYALSGNADLAFAQLALEAEQGLVSSSQLSEDKDLSALSSDRRWSATLALFVERRAALRASMNGELRDLFEQDQADRQGSHIDWSSVRPRDLAREKRVQEILDAGLAKASADYFHAAMVFQHGDTPAHAQQAHDLALRAVELDANNEHARWLVAAAGDRRLMYEKKPQKFGTQFTKNDAGQWVLWEVDPTVTDEDRAEWNVPTLESARQTAARMNLPVAP